MVSNMMKIEENAAVDGPVGREGGRSPSTRSTGQVPTTPVYVHGYLNGVEGPQVTTGPVSGVDGIEVSVIFDFGVGAIDWRGAWFNPGT
jgi:hypothetical protein